MINNIILVLVGVFSLGLILIGINEFVFLIGRIIDKIKGE